MKAVVFTLGCKVNECESDSLLSGLSDLGYQVSDKLVKADLYIVNTCAVTAEAEKKSRQTASRIKKIAPDAKIIFTGCACQNNPKQFAEKSDKYLITGTFDKNKILSMLNESGIKMSQPSNEFERLLPAKTLRTRTYVKVQDGCNNFCSYCLIPYLRGRTRSRDPQSVIDEITLLNPKEAVLNGINLSAYNYNGISLAGLIKSLSKVNCRIRLGSLEVGVIDREFLSALKELKDFAPHFHLSLQSGSDAVLKKMNRHYTTNEYYEKVCLIREYFPFAGITTDVIVGFPEESDEDFENTVNTCRRAKFFEMHVFPYSVRKGTRAEKMKQVDKRVALSRSARLREVASELKREFLLSQSGKEVEVFIEECEGEYGVGHTSNFIKVYTSCAPGEYVKQKISVPYKDGVKGENI